MTRPDNSKLRPQKDRQRSFRKPRSSATMANALKRTDGEGGLMIKWNETVYDRADEDLMVRINREQDDEFRQKLRAALRVGKETCPVGVSTEPGTKRPILKLSTA
jgi:hypothetical protein